MQQADLNPNEAPRYRCMMGSRCATIPQLTRRLWYGKTFSTRSPLSSSDTALLKSRREAPQGDPLGDQRSCNSGKTIAEPRCHSAATLLRLPECNSSAGEGRCGHIYSVCHRKAYFFPTRLTCAVTAHQRPCLGASPSGVMRSLPREPQPVCLLKFKPIIDAHRSNIGDLGWLGLVRFPSGHMTSDQLGHVWWGQWKSSVKMSFFFPSGGWVMN